MDKMDLQTKIEVSLDQADSFWKKERVVLLKSVASSNESMVFDSVQSNIPGYELVNDGSSSTDEFIALVADMRNSSQHLTTRINGTKTESGLHRVFLETSALLPVISELVEHNGGSVVEYLGDGALALFRVSAFESKEDAIIHAYQAASSIIGVGRNCINKALKTRYNLEEINIGIGLALSQALICLVGSGSSKQAKAIGECVYRATKISHETNKVAVDANMNSAWPINPKGTGGLRFNKRKKENLNLEFYTIS